MVQFDLHGEGRCLVRGRFHNSLSRFGMKTPKDSNIPNGSEAFKGFILGSSKAPEGTKTAHPVV